jgi:hypothetical protein
MALGRAEPPSVPGVNPWFRLIALFTTSVFGTSGQSVNDLGRIFFGGGIARL